MCEPAVREQQKHPACIALLLLFCNHSLASCSLSRLSKLALRLYVHAGRWEQQKSERRKDRLLAETPLGSPPAPPPAPSGPGALLGIRDQGLGCRDCSPLCRSRLDLVRFLPPRCTPCSAAGRVLSLLQFPILVDCLVPVPLQRRKPWISDMLDMCFCLMLFLVARSHWLVCE